MSFRILLVSSGLLVMVAGNVALASPSQWVGDATLTFSPNIVQCNGYQSDEVGPTIPVSLDTGFVLLYQSTGYAEAIIDVPKVKLNTSNSAAYSRKWVFSLTPTAGIFMPSVSVTSGYISNGLAFSGNDLNGSLTVHYVASNTNCILTINVIAIDAGS